MYVGKFTEDEGQTIVDLLDECDQEIIDNITNFSELPVELVSNYLVNQINYWKAVRKGIAYIRQQVIARTRN